MDNRYFKYNGKIYIQKKGLPMGSPASPIIADIVMEKLLDSSMEKLNEKPKIVTKYVDDLFCIIPESEIQLVLKTLNSFHPSIKFTVEIESNQKLPYLDLLVIRRDGSLSVDWYQKPTASGRIINYFSKHPKNIIINTANNLIRRVLSISDAEFIDKNRRTIKNILMDNDFPEILCDKLISNNTNKEFGTTNQANHDATFKSMIYIPEISERIQKSGCVDLSKYKIAQKTYYNIGQIFSRTKDKVERFEKSNLVYKIPCNGNHESGCNMVYIGTTKNKLKTRLSSHKSDQRNRKQNNLPKTALAAHCADRNHSPDFERTKILISENNYKRRYMLEMLHIINTPTNERINFKADTENCAQIYRHLVKKIK